MPIRNASKPVRGTVAVAMSGGVDSSLTALLLAEQGYRVIGLTLRLHDEGDGVNAARGTDRRCCHLEGVERARQAVLRAGGEHQVVDAREAFAASVIADFEREYARGRTPNPCVRCNTFLKWGLLFDQARRLGADFFATGHYARIGWDERGGAVLLRARDPDQDQAYALWGVPRPALARTLLPLGEWTKREVREQAAARGLAAATVPDSQDICFVPGDYRDFLERRAALRGAVPELALALRPGAIVDGSGRVLGRHAGTARYTIGQRHGLGVAAGIPLFVEGLDPQEGIVRVGEGEGLLVHTLTAEQANWVSIEVPAEAFGAEVRIRYSGPGYPATVQPTGTTTFTVRFDRPQRAVTPGQSAVVYQGERVLGGGIIAG
jgi:tRNA-specific 2-thiouridylase